MLTASDARSPVTYHHAVTEHPIADSVRLALASEAADIAAIQRRSWADRLPAPIADRMLADTTLEEMTEIWSAAIVRPPEARFRVLVALGSSQAEAEGAGSGAARVVGFATTVPSDDADADPSIDGAIGEFVVDRQAQRQGHGSRLLNATADTLRADGFTRARWWLDTTDDITRTFLTAAGWQPDGAHREIGTEDGSYRIKQVRLHTDISEPISASM
jgi:GNAT superfamily N-acetyltransferase